MGSLHKTVQRSLLVSKYLAENRQYRVKRSEVEASRSLLRYRESR